jgi:hypothetical protein
MTVGNFFSEIHRRFSLIKNVDILPFCGLIVISIITLISGGPIIVASAMLFGLKFTYRYVSSLVLLGIMWASVKSTLDNMEVNNSVAASIPTFETNHPYTIFGGILAFCAFSLLIFLQYKAFHMCKRNAELNRHVKNQTATS